MGAFTAITGIFNGTGPPSTSLPLGMSADGLTIGVMVTGRYGDDALLFRLAAQVERAVPWYARRPLQACTAAALKCAPYGLNGADTAPAPRASGDQLCRFGAHAQADPSEAGARRVGRPVDLLGNAFVFGWMRTQNWLQ